MKRICCLLASILMGFMAANTTAKTLFLAHWNGKLAADYAAGNPNPLPIPERSPQPGGTGYAFTNSMPAVAGLTLGNGQTLVFETAKNMNPLEGTVDFWFYLKTDYQSCQEYQCLWGTNNAPPPMGSDTWKNVRLLLFRGWSNDIRWSVAGDKANVGVNYLTDKWTANSRWHRIAATWSAKNKRISLYIDGRLVSRAENNTISSTLPAYFYIGSTCAYHEFAPHTYDEFRILDREISEVEAAVDYVRKTEFPSNDNANATQLFQPLDISKQATTPFEDETANDGKGGWTDQGSSSDMRNITKGKVSLLGIPFQIGSGCIVLAGTKRPDFPKSAEINVGARFDGLLFTHTAAWLMGPGKTVANYKINYTDGSVVTVPLVSHSNIGDWSVPEDLPEARAVLSCRGSWSGKVGSFLYFWSNPSPDKTIKSVVFETGNEEAVPILLAITGLKRGAGQDVLVGLNVLIRCKTDVAGEFSDFAASYRKAAARLPELRRTVAALTPKSPLPSSTAERDLWCKISEAQIYLRELTDMQPALDQAIAKNLYKDIREIQKALAYSHYVGEICKSIPVLRAKAEKTVGMTPIIPDKATFSRDADALFKKCLRTEISLNGLWDFAETQNPDQCGSTWKPFLVPADFAASQQFWLRRFVATPGEWSGRRIELHFECSRILTDVYVNRKFAGRHIGIEPFDIDISKFMEPNASNEILLYIAGRGCFSNGYNRGSNYVDGGIWESGLSHDVSLRVSPQISIAEPYARIDGSGKLILTGRILGALPQQSLEIELDMSSGTQSKSFGHFKVKPAADGSFTIAAPWSDPILWGIGGKYGEPNLVNLRLRLFDHAKLLDDLSFRTGFRRFDIVNRTQFQLNGQPFFIQGDHLWGTEGHSNCSNRAFICRYFRIAREANFNLVRIHIIDGGNTQSEILDAADELGFAIEPEAAGMNAPQLLNGEPNYDDPVLRENAKTYFRAFARKLRTHPSNLIFSLSNEVFLMAGRYIDDAAKFYLTMEKVVTAEMPDVVLTEQGNNGKNVFSTMDLHYASAGGFKNWTKTGDKPIIHGEWSLYENGYFDMNMPDPKQARRGENATAQNFEREIKAEIAAGFAGTMPFPASMIFGFCTASPDLMGPWSKEVLANKPHFNSNHWYLPGGRSAEIPITWPAYSGKGVKPQINRTGTQADNINFFDPSRKEFTPNKVYFACKKAFNPMPPISGKMSPEIIVTGARKDKSIPVFGCRDGSSFLTGVLPDDNGKAWFQFPDAGTYNFIDPSPAGYEKNGIKLSAQPVEQAPGFEYIYKLNLTK